MRACVFARRARRGAERDGAPAATASAFRQQRGLSLILVLVAPCALDCGLSMSGLGSGPAGDASVDGSGGQRDAATSDAISDDASPEGAPDAADADATGCGDTQSSSSNCGVCGHDCQGGLCVAGACQPVTLSSGEANPQEVAVSSGSIYWTTAMGGSAGHGAIRSCAVGSCTAVSVCPGDVGKNPLGIATDGTHLYWSLFGAMGGQDESAGWGPISGCNGGGNSIFTGRSGDGVAIDAAHVYFCDNGGGAVLQANLDGSNVQTLAGGEGGPAGVAVDAQYVYWTNNADMHNAVRRLLKSGGPPETIGQGGQATRVAVDAMHIYWTNRGDGTVALANLDGTAAAIVASGQMGAQGIAIDDSYVYWTSTMDGTVARCGLSGGCGTSPTVIAGGQNQPFGIAVATTTIYWANMRGEIMELAKPP
jgi:hypothetical protein